MAEFRVHEPKPFASLGWFGLVLCLGCGAEFEGDGSAVPGRGGSGGIADGGMAGGSGTGGDAGASTAGTSGSTSSAGAVASGGAAPELCDHPALLLPGEFHWDYENENDGQCVSFTVQDGALPDMGFTLDWGSPVELSGKVVVPLCAREMYSGASMAHGECGGEAICSVETDVPFDVNCVSLTFSVEPTENGFQITSVASAEEMRIKVQVVGGDCSDSPAGWLLAAENDVNAKLVEFLEAHEFPCAP